MHLEVIRFGQREPLRVAANQVITFLRGLVGMDALRRLVLVDDERIAPCRWLQSLDDPSLAFVVVDPHLVEPDYAAHVPPDDAALLHLEHPEDGELWALVTVQAEAARSTVNLLAPVVINRRARLGMQVILHDSAYSLRQPIGSPPSPRSLDAPPDGLGEARGTIGETGRGGAAGGARNGEEA